MSLICQQWTWSTGPDPNVDFPVIRKKGCSILYIVNLFNPE
ncbi:hypothetical protein [Calothrix sp. NIES-3974]|nr:hypothetical protein [Calothrix sp. NIES-3974]BAZ06505.1 hypothetical protein NIES3974_31660 [Calothrix sp. NIES-3974]